MTSVGRSLLSGHTATEVLAGTRTAATSAATTPGRAAVLSTVILLAIYLIVSYGAVALLGPDFATDSGRDRKSVV